MHIRAVEQILQRNLKDGICQWVNHSEIRSGEEVAGDLPPKLLLGVRGPPTCTRDGRATAATRSAATPPTTTPATGSTPLAQLRTPSRRTRCSATRSSTRATTPATETYGTQTSA